MQEQFLRRLAFWAGVLRTVGPRAASVAVGNRSPIIVLLFGALSTAASAGLFGVDSIAWKLAGVLTLLLTIGEAVYHEWDRWAPHAPPGLLIERSDWSGYMGFRVTNNDVPGTLRAKVVDVRGPNGILANGPDDMWPWAVAWGDDRAPERHLSRGEAERIRLVEFFDGGALKWFRFVGPDVAHDLRAHGFGSDQRDIEIRLQFVRIEPEPANLEHVERITWQPPRSN